MTYAVEFGGQQIAVTALALRPGGSVAAGDLSEALADLPVGLRPTSCMWSPTWRSARRIGPLIEPVARDGIPKPSRNAWYLDTDTNRYKRLTVAVRAEIAGADS